MTKRFSERILEFLRRPDYRPMKTPRLAKAMGIAEAEQGSFSETVDALRRVGRVVLGTNNAVMLPHPPNQVVGTFRGNPRGFGFVVPDGATGHGDLYVSSRHTLDAVTGDRVLCQVLSRGKRDGKDAFGGRIIKIVERGDGRFVGQLRREGGLWFVQPDGNTLHVPIMVDDVGAKRARAGDQVVVEIVRYPSEGKPARGVIVERLGKQGAPGVDLASVMRQFHLPDSFPEEVLDEARRVTRNYDPDAVLRHREDLTGRVIVTIDPDDAKDFDDAITLEKLNGTGGGSRSGRKSQRRAAWELGVHIADVSAFVLEGGALDAEARGRGTSVYFPGFVIPMLPEILSNGVCSLQEGERRVTKSAFIQYDANGTVVGTRFANSVIRSTCRLTYNQATQILAGRPGRLPKPVVSLVKEMDRLARVIQKRRLAEGMVVLDLPEVDLVLDDNGRVIDAVPEDTSFSHTIIEMFMVEANEAVARLMANRNIPCLRRIHPEPDESSLAAMARFMRAAGYAVPRKMTAADLQKLLEPLRGKPDAYAVNLAVLKSMSLAEYSPKLVGHFALASRHYAHFTSPIRRYPDLMLHRLLDRVIAGQLGGRQKRGLEEVPSEVELEDAGRKLSYASRRAEAAERELRTVKLLQLLSDHVGDEFDGVVTGVTNFGLFVQHPKYLIDGLLRVEDLGDDWWDVDVKVGRVTGERTRQSFTMGTILPVRIAEVDVSSRQLSLVLSSSGRRPIQRRRLSPGDTGPRGKRGRPDNRRRNTKGQRKADRRAARSRHR